MKRSIAVAAFLSMLASARGDLVIQQKIEGGGQNGTVTTLRLKNNKLRVDIASRAGPVSSIMDMDTGESFTLMHGQKLFTKLDSAKTKEAIEALKKKAGREATGEVVKSEATGKKERVGEFNTEVFTWKGANGTQTMWVTKDLPNYAKVKEQFDRLSKSPVAAAQKGIAPDMTVLPGVVVKTELETSGQKFTSTVLSVKEEEINPALFEVPSDYRDSAMRGKPDPAPTPTPEPAPEPAAEK
jgi:Domain of unknown function (DUF4412)